MKTSIPKLILTILVLFGFWDSHAEFTTTVSNPDVRVFVTLPTSTESSDGIIDIIINSGTSPYYIQYFKKDNSGGYTLIHEVSSYNNGDEDLLNASVGTYRVEIADAYCAFLSLEVVVSFECDCTYPVLYYNSTECFLHWNPQCENGFTYTLEYFSNNNWVEQQTLDARFPIQSNGNYRIKLTREGCSVQYSEVVTTSCSLPIECRCIPPSISYIAGNCELTWESDICPGFTSTLQRRTSSKIWENITNAVSPFTLIQNGSYRLMYSNTNCLPVFSDLVNVTCVQTDTVSQGSLIINEFSQGCRGMQEYIELIVTGSTPYVTVEGMIIDDNNHLDFEQGNESGHIRLGSCFSYVPVGSIILIYNDADINPLIDPSQNGTPGRTGIYQLSVNDPCIVHYPACPDNHTGRTDYNCSPGKSGGWRDLIPLYNLRDVVQVRKENGELVEAIVYGGAQFSSTEGNIITIPNSSNLTLFKRSGNNTWTASDPCPNNRPFPGVTVNPENESLIKEINTTDISGLYLFPNPAYSYLNIVSTKEIEYIEIFDIIGRLVYRQQYNLDKSSQISIEHLLEGVHLVKVIYTDKSEEYRKFIKI